MKKIVLCICSDNIPLLEKCILVFEGIYVDIHVVGKVCVRVDDGVCFFAETPDSIAADFLKTIEYDYVFVLGDEVTNRSRVVRFLNEYGVEREKIIPDKVICLHGFTIEKYRELLKSKITIFSNNCAAGLLYHLFCMPFYSPTINMYQLNDSFLRFAKAPFKYLSKELVFDRYEKNEYMDYPVYRLDDVELHMNHYKERLQAEKTWYQRLGRINPDNMLFMMYTEKTEDLAWFHFLPYKKKVCFCSFQANLHEAYPIPPVDRLAEFWQLVLAVADGSLECYDLWDMLLKGEKTQIMEF